MKDVSYGVKQGADVLEDEQFRHKCMALYSNHYGMWGKAALPKQVGNRVQLTDALFRNWLLDQCACIYYAQHGNDIIGYAVVLQKDVPSYGIVTWVTQLVVHQDFRNRGIAKQILLSVWGFSDHRTWGIVTANPYAVHALEKVTRRRVEPKRVMQDEKLLRSFAYSNISYINENTQFDINEDTSKVNTEFFVDHTDVPQQIMNVSSDDVPWLLGKIEEGWEWFAFTFKDQKVLALKSEEIERFLDTSDSIVKNAYARMQMESKMQKWTQHTDYEIDYILDKTHISLGAKIYDLGCGQGRNAIELAKRGYDVTGIDYVDEHIVKAKNDAAKNIKGRLEFLYGDCRCFKCEKSAELVLCLYDVVGSFADLESNIKILRTAYNLLRLGGFFVLSVMNYELTYSQAKYCFEFKKDPNRVFSLAPSKIMETTGSVFNPEYYLVDTSEHIVYRKEQFSTQRGYLPAELLVRDRRFAMKEIEGMCREVGFKDVRSKFVNAASWERDYEACDSKAKKILLICVK